MDMDQPIRSTRREEAHRLLELNYIVLPADPVKKHPPFEWKRFQFTPPTPEELDQLFDQFPTATGLGIVTTGLVVLDLDAMPDGAPNPFPEDPDHRMALSCAPAVITPRGGLHLYFQAPIDITIPNSASKIADRVDIRAAGGFLMVPPTVRGDRTYEWRGGDVLNVSPDQLPELPQFILDLLTATAPEERRGRVPLDGPIVDGERNTSLFKLASKWRGQGHGEADVLALLRRHNADRCQPPLDDDELVKIAKSACQFEPNSPPRPLHEYLHPDLQRKRMPGDPDAAAQNSGPRHIKFITMAELAGRPAPTWLIPDLIPDHGLGFVIGRPGAGKSFFLQELAQSVCRGVPLFGDPDLTPSRSGWVLCILPEASPSWGTRTKSYCDYHDVHYSDELCACIEPLDLGDESTWWHLETAVADEISMRGVPPALVIVDTLSSALPGRDENSQADVTPLMSRLHGLVSLGAAVVVSHHTAKHSTAYRGSSVLHGSCDWMLSVIDTPGGVREFRADKLRDAESITSKAFALHKHGDSAVCVSTEAAGPWASLNLAEIVHPGLKEALVSHGLEIPGEDKRKATGEDFGGAGVSLKQIKETWRKIRPITPSNSDDPKGYKAADRQRTTALIGIVESLIRSGALTLVSGVVSKSDRKLDAVVRQEADHERS